MSLIQHSIPLIYVSHLPSASSYYASLTQPLNIRYLTATTTFPATLHFGRLTPSGTETLFSLTQSATPTPPLTTIYLPASSPKQIQDFFAKSRTLNPGCRETGVVDLNGVVEGEGSKVVTRDLDGHMIEAIYSTRTSGGSTASTEKESRRVLEWQKIVAESVASGGKAGGSQAGTEVISRRDLGQGRRADSAPLRLVRRETVTETWAPTDQQPSTGISGKAIIGTLLGAAAGAAVAYAMVRSEEPPRSSHEQVRRSSYSHPPAIDMIPARSHVSARDLRAQQEGVVERPQYTRYAIAPAPSPPPTLMRAGTWAGGEIKQLDQRSHVSARSSASHRSSKTRSRSEHPAASAAGSRFDKPLTILPASTQDRDGGGSHVSSRSRRSRARSHVSGSRTSRKDDVVEVFEDDADLDDRKSIARSSHSKHSKHSSHSKHHHSRNPHVEDAQSEASNSYTSARSHASSSTIKPSKSRRSSHTGGGGAVITISGHDGVRVVDTRDFRESDRRSHVSARDVPLPRSTVSVARDVPLPRSTISVARGVPLPMSVVSGRGEREYGYMDGGGGYAASVAPSDSVSCVGGKRERERLRGRMGREVGW